MAVPEAQLDTWSKPGSLAQSRDTYATIKNALEAAGSPYSGKNYTVFLQGSYSNDTNVYRESDVDVVIVLNQTYYSDLTNLSEAETAAYNQHRVAATYGYYDFKSDVTAWLKTKVDQRANAGDKAIFIPTSGNRRNADVIVAAQYRRYHRFQSVSNEQHDEGICFFASDGTLVGNFPKQHSGNCTIKHQATGSFFKPTVRIFKNMRNRMIADGIIEDRLAPSYYIEGLLYNVPVVKFGRNYQDTFINCFNWLESTNRNDFICANERYYLLREGSSVTWRAEKCTQFLTAMADFWRDW
jgi:Nucleotidyltransferase domain